MYRICTLMSMKRTKLYVVRHGQTDWNKEKRIQGLKDIELNDEGIRQAKILSEVFKALPINAVYCSKLKRTKQTAQEIANVFEHPVIENEHIHEKNMGSVEGLKMSEYRAQFQDKLDEHLNLNFYERLFNKIVDDAESAIDVAERVLPALHSICQNHYGEHVVIVTHGWVIKLLLILIDKYQEESIHVDNGAILEMEGNGKELSIVTFQGIKGEKKPLFTQ